MSANLFNPGLKGTLAPEEYTNSPMPHWGPNYPSPSTPYNYGGVDMILVSYACDAKKAAALLPEELTLVDIPALPGQCAVNHVFNKFRENDAIGPYTEFLLSIPVLHKGNLYLYVPAIYVDNDAALTAGREFGGYPKKMAHITMRNYGDVYLSHMSRGSMQEKSADPNFSDVASSYFRRGGKLASVPLAADKTPQIPFPYNLLLPLPPPTGQPQNIILPTCGLLRIPGIGPGPEGAMGAQAIQLVASPWVVTKAEFFIGTEASVELYPSKEDPLADLLPIDTVIGSYMLRGELYTDPSNWTLLEDLKKRTTKAKA